MDEGDPSDLFVVAAGAEALAKLGDGALVGAAIELARFAPSEDTGFHDGAQVRLQAVRALDVGVARGVAPALHAAVADGNREVAVAALRATLHLGRAGAVPTWLSALARADEQVAAEAEYCLAQLTGEAPPSSAKEAMAWWGRLDSRFDAGICYRLGQPATPGVLLSGASGRDSALARAELRHAGACVFVHVELSDTTPRERAAIHAWWAANGARFTPGALHRWGRTFEPDAVA
jgi:hypothetical protein